MDNLDDSAKEDNQVNEEKPPPRVCPRCSSNNTRFCYYNNHKVTQPRYLCKKCREHWTHGGVIRNMPNIGGNSRTPKRPKVVQSSVSQMVYAENQPVNHQPFIHTQENNEFVESFGGSSSSSSVSGNHFDYLSELDALFNVPPVQNFEPLMDHLNFGDELFQQDYSNVGSNDLIGNPFINQPFGEYVDNHNSYCIINQVDQYDWSQIFNTIASSSGSRESSDPR